MRPCGTVAVVIIDDAFAVITHYLDSRENTTEMAMSIS